MALDLTCEDFGLSQDEMLERLLNKMADRLLQANVEEYDEEIGAEYQYVKQTELVSKLGDIMRERVDEQVRAIAEEHVIPKIDTLIDGLTFQETNTWGEAKKPPQTIREWIESQAIGWLDEEVDSYGKTEKQDPYSWSKHSTRLVYTIEKHVAWHLDESIKKATKDLHATFAGQVSQLVNDVIRNMSVKMSADVKAKR